MKFYCASPHASASEIDVVDANHPAGGYALNPRWDLGTVYGPGQVALALLADALGDDAKAVKHATEFRFRVLSRLEGREWELSQEDIRQEIVDIELLQPRGHESVRGKAGRRV
jgi:hypothetical protein